MVLMQSVRRVSLLVAVLAFVACSADINPQEPGEPVPELEAPKLRSPMNNAYVGSVHVPASLAPTFRWEPITSAAPASFYEVQLSSDAGFARSLITFTTEETQVKPMFELPVARVVPVGARYYWRVRACDDTTCSTYSPGRSLNLGRSDRDVNGDGFADMVAGFPTYSGEGRAQVHIYHGGAVATFDAEPDGTLVAPVAKDHFGTQVAVAGDVNGDRFADVIVGAPEADGQAGAAYVYFGGPDSSFDPTPDLVLHGSAPGDRFGSAVAGAGDLNSDGIADLVVSAPSATSGDGAVYVYLGRADGGLSTHTIALRDIRCGFCRALGLGIAPAGDVDGDNYDDLAVAVNSSARTNGFVFFGDAAGTFDAYIPLSDGGLGSIAGGSDVDGDGFADVLVSGVGASATLYFGDSERGRRNIFTVTYSELDAGFGASVALPGDVDGDGFGDVLIGADPHHQGSAGGAYLYAGSPRAALASLAYSKIVGSVETVSFVERWRVGSPGDVNGDGFADLEILDMPPALSRSSRVGSTFVFAGGKRQALDAPAYGVLHSADVPRPDGSGPSRSPVLGDAVPQR